MSAIKSWNHFGALALAAPLLGSAAVAHDGRADALRAELVANATLDLEQRVLYDRPGDGSLWAVGRNWKMCFDAAGATYYPFLGSDAPRNFPLRFQLRRATSGGVELPLRAPAPATLAGDAVEISHGPLVERYLLAPDSVEQLFVLREPASVGEIALELDVHTELERSELAGHLSFSNEHGRVSYTRAVAIDDRGARCELATRITPNGIRIDVPADFAARAAWPLVIDPVITTIDVSETASDDERPDVAWDETNGVFAVVWERVFSGSDSDVYARYFSGETGAPIANSQQSVDTTNEDWRDPSVAEASATDTFLFVAERGAQGSQSIWGRVREADSNVSGNQFQISNLTGYHIHPVAGGGRTPNLPSGRFLVVWERVRPGAGDDRDIWGQILSGDGGLIGDHVPIESSINTDDRNPAISKTKGAESNPWTVVWQRNQNANDADILGARVDADGDVAVPTFEIDAFSTNTDFPVVSSPLEGSNQYLVAYRAFVLGHNHVFSRLYQGNSTDPIDALTITTHDGAPDTSKSRPFIDASDCRFVVTYSELQSSFDSDVFATSMSVDGTNLVIEEGYVYLGGDAEVASPAPIASTGYDSDAGQRFLAVWDQFNPLGTDNDIFGTVFEPVGTIGGCDPTPGTPYCFGVDCPCGNDSPLSGCANSTGVGATLVGTGSASIAADDLGMSMAQLVPNQPVLLFSADQALNGGAGIAFGDGLRCAGFAVIRLGTQPAGADGTLDFGPGLISLESGPAPGQIRRYQGWYRNPTGGPCGSGFNLTNGFAVTFTP